MTASSKRDVAFFLFGVVTAFLRHPASPRIMRDSSAHRGTVNAQRIGIGIFVLLFGSLCATVSYAADWHHYGLDEDANFLYYDKNAIDTADGVVRVWQRKVFTSDNLFRIRQVLGERYYKLLEKLTLYEINCAARTYQERAFAYYDNEGRYIDGRYREFVRDWKKISGQADMVRLFRICCPDAAQR